MGARCIPQHWTFGVSALSVVAALGCGPQKVVEGDVTISSQEELEAFSELEEVNGTLTIDDSDLANLAGLSNLEWVGGDLQIGGAGNDALTSVTGLEGLARIEGDLVVENNDLLTDLNGLSGLRSTGWSVTVIGNDRLTTLGLARLEDVRNSFELDGNVSLVDLGRLPMTYVDFTLRIDGNSSLQNLRSLSSLQTVGRLFIRNNLTLPQCAAEGLQAQLDAFDIWGRYDDAVELTGNNAQGSCSGGPLG